MWLNGILKQVNVFISKIEVVFLIFGTISLAVILITNVIARKAGGSIYYIDELASLLLIWITFVGTSYATRKGRHVRMSAVYDLLPQKPKKILTYISATIGMIAMLYAGYLSYRYLYKIYTLGQITPNLQIPYWIGISIVPIGFFMSSIHYMRTITKNMVKKDEVWLSPEQKTEYDEIGEI